MVIKFAQIKWRSRKEKEYSIKNNRTVTNPEEIWEDYNTEMTRMHSPKVT